MKATVMVRYVRYTIILLSVVFLLATSVSAAMPQNTPTSPFMSKSQSTQPNSEAKPPLAPETEPPNMPMQPDDLGVPIIYEAVEPSTSAPVGSLPTAVPRDPNATPQEINPRQNPTTP